MYQLGQSVDSLLADVNQWIERFEAVPASQQFRYPARHDLKDEVGDWVSFDAYLSVLSGEPYAYALKNMVMFNGPQMAKFAALWRNTLVPRFGLGKPPGGVSISSLPNAQQELYMRERRPPTGGASTVAEALPVLRRVRSLLLAEKTGTAPEPVLVSTKPGRGVVYGIAGIAAVAVLAGVVYAVQRS